MYAMIVCISQPRQWMSRLCDLNKYSSEYNCLVYMLANFPRVSGVFQVVMTMTAFLDVQYIC